MHCTYLRDFAEFQVSLILKENENPSNDEAIEWINANSEEVRKCFCSGICPLRGIRKECDWLSKQKS